MRKPGLVVVNHTGLVSGAEAVMLRLVACAADHGWDTSVAVPEGPLAAKAREAGASHLRLPDLMLPAGPKPVATMRLAGRYARAARVLQHGASGASVVVANGLRVLPALRLARLGAPVVWLAQSMVDRPRWRLMLDACAGGIDSTVAVSEAVARSIGTRSFPVDVVWNGTPWPVPPAAAAPPPPPVVGCASLLTSWKGQDVLLEALARLDRHDVVVELMGGTFPKDRPFVDALHRRAAAPDLAGRVRFLGRHDDPLERMRQWSIAVLPSVEPEAAPLVLLEAMSVGLAVVATDHGGPPEVVGDAGLLVPPRDPDALAAAITALLDDDDRRRSCAEAGRRAIEARFRLDDQIEKLFSTVTSGSREVEGRRLYRTDRA